MKKLYSVGMVVTAVVYMLCMPHAAYASYRSMLPVPQFSQHLSFPDSNGDTGYFDCAIAAEAMALQTLAVEGKIPLSVDTVTYATVRQSIRTKYSDIGKGITLREAATTIPHITNNTLSAAFIKFDRYRWKEALYRQLHVGYPVIVHISDWSYLAGHRGSGSSAHAIVITGMDERTIYYIDPWDGKYHGIAYASFAAAWAQGNYNWSAIVFIEKKEPTNFTDLMRLLAAKHAA